MSEECDICGEEFDSERGLHIHQGKEHSEENQSNEGQNQGKNGISITPRQFGASAFTFGLLLGLVLGGIGTSVLGTSQNTIEAAPSGNTDNADNNGNTGNQGPESLDTVVMSNIETEGEPILGEEDAPVTMVMYEDFQCPFCKRFETETYPQIKSDYIDEGKVKVVWKDKPIPSLGHDWAEPSAAAMECVYRQNNDAFWNVKDELFSQAKTTTQGEEEFTPDNIQPRIIEMASEEGVSSSEIQSCIDNENPMNEVNADSQEADEIGASGTPTFFINGKKLVGAQPYSRFETVIEGEIN